jgi:hypothetical protein
MNYLRLNFGMNAQYNFNSHKHIKSNLRKMQYIIIKQKTEGDHSKACVSGELSIGSMLNFFYTTFFYLK